MADLVGCLNGRFFAIEVKRPGEIPTVLQAHELHIIRQAGGYGMWTDNLEDIRQFVKDAS